MSTRETIKALRAALETLLRDLEESHADEVASEHYGDGPICSYCVDMENAKAALALLGPDPDPEEETRDMRERYDAADPTTIAWAESR